jgi:hypothetical protein
MEFHQQFIDHAPVEGRDHIGKGLVEGALAIGNGESHAHAESSTNGATLAGHPQ